MEKNVLIRYPKVCFIEVKQIKDDIFELNSLHLTVYFHNSNSNFDYKSEECLNECWGKVHDIFKIAMVVSTKYVDCDQKIVTESSPKITSLNSIKRRESTLIDIFKDLLKNPDFDPCLYSTYERYKRMMLNDILSNFLRTYVDLKIDGSEFNKVKDYLSSLFWEELHNTYHDANCED